MAANDVFGRLGNTFNDDGDYGLKAVGEDKPNQLTRYFGGHNRKNHPYVSGYWQFIMSPPDKIFEGGNIKEDSVNWAHSTAEAFTPPTRNLNKADVPGQGGLGSSYVVGQTLNRTFTVTFREYTDLPISTIFELWTSVIDPYTGVSPLSGKDWIPSNYKGSALAILTKPSISHSGKEISANEIEQAFFFHGVWPEGHPMESFASDISGNDVITHSITFSFDGWPLTKADEGVISKAVEVLQDWKYYDNTYNATFMSDLQA